MGGQNDKNDAFADKATEILYESLSELSPEEQDRRLDAVENAVYVDEFCRTSQHPRARHA